jgi:predicted RNA-binding Zn-ribbon protein involved in translation (DUF1610 family)
MFRKLGILIAVILFLSTFAFAGSIIRLVCDHCGYKSQKLFAEGGFLGSNTIIFCEKCKKFYTIVTEVYRQDRTPNLKPVEPIGKKIFLGEERLLYPCPKCGKGAVAYSGPICPICKKGKLSQLFKGLWD